MTWILSPEWLAAYGTLFTQTSALPDIANWMRQAAPTTPSQRAQAQFLALPDSSKREVAEETLARMSADSEESMMNEIQENNAYMKRFRPSDGTPVQRANALADELQTLRDEHTKLLADYGALVRKYGPR